MDFSPTGKLIATMAGPNCCDRIFFVNSSANFGWPNCGTTSQPTCSSPYTPSLYQFATPTVTPTGIAYSTIPSILYFGEFNTGNLMQLTLTSTGTVANISTAATVGSGILAVERGLDGLIYFSTPDTIYRLNSPLTPCSPPPQSNLACTTLTLSASTNLGLVNRPVVFTVAMRGSWHELNGVIVSKQISVSAFGTSGQCTTGLDGSCQVTLVAPPVEGSYTVTAMFAGDSNFLPSSSSLSLIIVSTGKITVGLLLNTYKVVNVQVSILQGSTIVASQLVTLTPSNPSATLKFTLNGGTYTVRVSGYSVLTQTRTVTIPPDAAVNFIII